MSGGPPVPGRTVSVVMTTCNGAPFVREQLESILAQTVVPAEVLVSDDRSTDDTLAVVAEVAADATIPVRVHRNDFRLGFSDNFLSAAARATGDFVAFSDQDDRWRPHKLEAGLQGLARHRAVLSAHRVGHIDAAGARLPSTRPSAGEDVVTALGDADPWGNFYGFTMLFERKLLGRLPASERGRDPYDQSPVLAHDRWLWFLASTFGRMVLLDEELADYRQHDGQLYGGLQPRSARQRLATKMQTGQVQSLALAGIARDRAALLERDVAAAQDDDGALRIAAAQRWRRWESGLTRSAVLYGGAGATRRAGAFIAGYRRGAYGSYAAGGLGPRRMRHDLVMAATPRWVGGIGRSGRPQNPAEHGTTTAVER